MTSTSGFGGAEPVEGTPGWFPDPWGTEKLRWWDGRAWTPHLYPPAESSPSGTVGSATPAGTAGGTGTNGAAGVDRSTGWPGGASASGSHGAVTGEVRLAPMRSSAHWASLAMLWAGPLQALYYVAFGFQARWYADHFSDFRAGRTPTLTGTAASVAPVLQFASLAVLAAGVIFLVWMYRSADLARLLGIPARRTPALAACSFIIPILNLWWPYQSTCDLLPPGHRGRHVVARWWALYLVSTLSFIVVVASGFGPSWLTAAVVAVVAIVTLAAATAARLVIHVVLDAHESIVSSASH
ncbi:MAG TPA: DUF4328 domain-containing protein [Acidimicrobiia bacterium]|nr:DUF4328 domain-containing protein [Acidimicrobiia bacterium]